MLERQNLINLARTLDNLIKHLDKLPGAFENEVILASQVDTDHRETSLQVWKETHHQLEFIKIFCSQSIISLKMLQMTKFKARLASQDDGNYYFASIHLSRPRIGDCWLARVVDFNMSQLVATGKTRNETIASALRALAERIESDNSSA